MSGSASPIRRVTHGMSDNKRLAFESSANQVRYLLNRSDLTDFERETVV